MLLVIAGEGPGSAQVWLLSYPAARYEESPNDFKPVPRDRDSRDGKKFITIQASGLVNIWIASEGDATQCVTLPQERWLL